MASTIPDHNQTTSECEAEGSEPSHPPLLQLSLRDSFVEAGSRLQLSNPDLFASAINQLSAQFSLAIARNPEFLSSSSSSRPPSSSTKNKVSLKRERDLFAQSLTRLMAMKSHKSVGHITSTLFRVVLKTKSITSA